MQVKCTQCGAGVDLEEGSRFVVCPFCSSALYLDRSQVVFHFVASATIDQEEAKGTLRRWMAGNETVKHLDVHAEIRHEELLYFPMWRFVVAEPGGEREYSQPASSFSISEIKSIPLSGGNLKFFSPSEFSGVTLKPPEVLLDSAIQWLQNQSGVQKESIREKNLIHIPFYLFKYQYKGVLYQSVVDAISGRVLAAIYPAKDEVPFIGIALMAAFTFLVAGLVAPNFLIRLGLFIVVAIPFTLIANAIVKRY